GIAVRSLRRQSCSIVSAPLTSLMRRRSPRPSWKTAAFGFVPGASAGSMGSPQLWASADARTMPLTVKKARAAKSLIGGALKCLLQDGHRAGEFCHGRILLLERRTCGRGRCRRTHLVLGRRLGAEQMLDEVVPSAANHVRFVAESVIAIRKQQQIEIL